MKAGIIIKGLTLLLIGLILLANTLNLLDWSVWSNIFKLWPLLLISWGISLIFRGKSLYLLGPLILFLGIGFGVVSSYMGIGLEEKIEVEMKTLSREAVIEVEEEVVEVETVTPQVEGEITPTTPETESAKEGEGVVVETETAEAPTKVKKLIPVEKAKIDLDFTAATLEIGGFTPLLYECIAEYRYKPFEPFETFSATDKEAKVLISHSATQGNYSNPRNKWQLKLNNQIIYDLNIKTGAINLNGDLSTFQINNFYLKSGASNIKLKIPQNNSKFIIDTGAANIEILIPKKVGALVNIDSGISVKKLDDFDKQNDTYLSKNYEQAEFKTEIDIKCGVSNIKFSYID